MASSRRISRVAAVILDMDGLMIDTETPVQACCEQAAADLGFTLDGEFYERALVGRSWPDCDAALVARVRQPSVAARERAFSVLPSLKDAEKLISSWLVAPRPVVRTRSES